MTKPRAKSKGRQAAKRQIPRRRPREKALRLQLPATSANLGPGFDAAALAVQMHLRITARKAKSFAIRARGRDAEICGRTSPNLILDTYRDILEKEGHEAIPLKLNIQNGIPIGKGCGSSAAARLAGIALAVYFGQLDWTEERIVQEAARREGHGDNAAACWLGGLTVQAEDEGRKGFYTSRLPGNPRWPLLLAMPRKGLATEESRQALPTRYERSEAVRNIQNAMLLPLAWQSRRVDLLAAAMRDHMHEPYREALCPLLKHLGELRGTEGIAGVALSGAGPGVLIVLDPAWARWRIHERIKNFLWDRNVAAELISTVADGHGAVFYWRRRHRGGRRRERKKD